MSKLSKVRYTPKAHDGIHTEEQQAQCLSRDAYRAWEHWANNEGVQGQDALLDNAMRILRQSIDRMDIFYAGKHIGENK